VLEQRDAQAVGVCDVALLVGEEFAELHGVAQRVAHVLEAVDRVGHQRELGRKHHGRHRTAAEMGVLSYRR